MGSYFGDPIVEGSKADAIISSMQTLLYLFGGNTSDFRHNINPTFMHSTSAIDFQNANNPLEYNFQGEDISCYNKTPFDRVYAPATNQVHVQLTDENAVWFDNEIKGTPQPVIFKSPYTITGPNEICNSAVYTIPNLPTGTIPTWSSTGNVTIVVGSNIGNAVNVTSTPGTGNLTATTVNACGNLEITTKSTFKGPAPLAWFTSKTDYYGLNLTIPAQTGCTYQWRLNGVLVSTTNNYRIPYPSCGSGANTWFPIQLTVTNACGATGVSNQYYTYDCYPTSGFRFVYSTDGSSGLRMANDSNYSFYPNPANTQLTISAAPTTSKNSDVAKSETLQTSDNKQFEVVLYDDKGKKLAQQKNDTKNKDIEINTQNIPNGTYFLHIFEGKEITIKQIVIQHP
ncbi:MAG: T9SS C-terminal target domain-containing protein [Sphingobacteriales bacterium]|nr:MAG: T9SS C-terminal target domain-containing protein [Sphingobacteriales bacterium]